MKTFINPFKFLISFIIVIASYGVLRAQDNPDYERSIDPKNFNANLLAEAILDEINELRRQDKLDDLVSHDILIRAAQDQAGYMGKVMTVTYENKGKKKATTAKRAALYGGSKNVEEILYTLAIKKGKNAYTYKQLANELAQKWYKSKKEGLALKNPKYVYIGIGTALDLKEKAYASAVVGNYTSINSGAAKRKKLKVPFTKKRYGLQPYDEKLCKACDKLKPADLERLQKGIYVENGKVFFKMDKYGAFAKDFLRGDKDALAVEFIQKDQFVCNDDNIINYNLNNKGFFTKRMWAAKIEKANLKKAKKDFKANKTDKKAKFDEGKFLKEDKLDFRIAKKMPKFPNRYEMNLVLIVDGHYCRTITPTYTETSDVDVSIALSPINDNQTFKVKSNYKPVADSATLSFRIPFERNKYTYNQADIDPFVKSLNEPDFMIMELFIAAYSSIEGSEEINSNLQKKRAESIIEALKSSQAKDRQDSIKTRIKTSDSWDFFRDTIGKTEFDYLANTTLDSVLLIINQKGLLKQLEPILAQHRFAQIEMKVQYDISGNKEQAFVLSKFNKSFKKKEKMATIAAIQNYIFEKVNEKKYSYDAIANMLIPEQKQYLPLLINKLNFEWEYKGQSNPADYCTQMAKLYKIDSTNGFIAYNHLYCKVTNSDIINNADISRTQSAIEALYSKKEIEKEKVDKLNLEYQFKIIRTLDTSENATPNAYLNAATERIKRLLAIEEANWQNALKLANLVIRLQKDYAYAIKLIEPYVREADADQELLFTYISLCSYYPEKIYTNAFAEAAKNASTKNPTRFCELFNGSKFPLQGLENLKVKEIYCGTCK